MFSFLFYSSFLTFSLSAFSWDKLATSWLFYWLLFTFCLYLLFLFELFDFFPDPCPKHACLKLLKAIMTTVTLSSVLLRSEFLSMYSTPMPLCLWTLFANDNVLLSFTLFHTHWIVSSLLSLSNIPSQPRTTKSCSLEILNCLISGVAITTLGLPPNLSSLASASPNVLDTDSLPGSTLRGPTITSFLLGLLPSAFTGAVAVRL
jgi:hypothetical protein